MVKTLTPPPSRNHRHWWPRISSTKGSTSDTLLYSDLPPFGTRPNSAISTTTPSLMTSVTNPKSMSSSSFTSSSKSSSRFNLAAVIGFGSRSKKQQPVDIQDPPPQVRPVASSKPISHREFRVPPQPTTSANPRLSRGVASSVSGTSIASTNGPLTPSDDPLSSASRTSYQHSLMTLTDHDPFATLRPVNERRTSTHSDKSISKRLMQKLDGKSAKVSVRLPVGDGPKVKDNRDRNATLPSRGRSANSTPDAYQPLRAVDPPWTKDSSPASPPSSSHSTLLSYATTNPTTTASQSPNSSKLALSWPEAPRRGGAGVEALTQMHQRTQSSSSISNDHIPDSSRGHKRRPSTATSIPSSPPPAYTSPLSTPKPDPPSAETDSPADTHHPTMSLTKTLSTPIHRTTPTAARTIPKPPPTADLPPTPTTVIDISRSPHLQPPPPSPSTDQHPLRSRSATTASVSALSFASSLSSLSFNSRPSPQDPPSRGADEYALLLNETLPVPGEENVQRRGSNSGSSSASQKSGKAKEHNNSKPEWGILTPKVPQGTLSNSRPLPPLPASPVRGSQTISLSFKRERALSATSSTFSINGDGGRVLRKQHSFHNSSSQAPTPLLRHHNSFDPIAPSNVGSSLRPPSLRSPPPGDLPALPPAGTGNRASTGKDSATSPRRKLFGGYNKHERERERERKQELENVDVSVPAGTSTLNAQTPTLHHASSWLDERSAGLEPVSASASPTSASTTSHDVAQHIVPPAELLRLGAAWERENKNVTGLRRAKSSWSSRDSDLSHTSFASSSSRAPLPRSAGYGTYPANLSSSKLPRSASLLSKATSAPSFGRPRERTPELSFAASSPSVSQESYTSLSPPPPRRQQRVRPSTQSTTSAIPLASRRTLSNVSAASTGVIPPPPPKGALIERKPSFLDMSAATQTVTLAIPELADREELERDSFLELSSSRGMDSIDTIRESFDSVDSFMQ